MEIDRRNTLIGFIVSVGVIFLLALLIQVIWNGVVVDMFPDQNLTEIGYWDALAIFTLAKILFGVL
jgi:hypothetical protein